MVAPGGPPLGGRYELGSLLATGGMGQVWRGRDLLLGRPVAVKVLRSEYADDPTFLARFRAEAHHAALLVHRNIAAVFDYGEVPASAGSGEHLAYLVMELVEGESLSGLLAREGRLPVDRTLDVLRQAAAGLAAAHAAGVVHRDVKPGNLLVGADGVVRVADFGVAWSASDVPLTQTGQVVGTAQYLSPEQADGGRSGPASDVYALGMVAYECLAGRRAFDGGTPVQIALRQIREEPAPLPDDVPEPVRALVARALRKDPEERLPDGAAFRDAVDAVLAGRPLPAPPPTRPLDVVRGPRRRLRRALVPMAALVAGAGIGVGGLVIAAPAAVPPAVADTATGAGIVLRSTDHVGRPLDEVEDALAAAGLRVTTVPSPTDTVAPGTVLAVSPVGALARGDLVTVTYAVAPPPSPSVASSSSASAPSASPEPVAPSVPVQAAVPPAPAPVEAVDGGGAGSGGSGGSDGSSGNGRGQGNGNGGGHGNGGGNGNGRGR